MRIQDKAKKKIINDIIKQVKITQHSKSLYRNILLLNSKIIGYHNYYRIATKCSEDFGDIAFIVSRAIKHKLKPKRTGIATGYVKEKYGKSRQMRFVADTALVPIGYVQFDTPIAKKRTINNYTVEGREEIHKRLYNIDVSILRHLMEHVSNENAEFYNNKIALYSGQNGKCFITGVQLEIGNIHCHHKNPRYIKIDNSYGNLVLVTRDVHRLIHAVTDETIEYYLNIIKPDKKQIFKINKLRDLLGLSSS